MTKKEKLSLITNHAVVLAYIARHPKPSTQEVAEATGLSVRGVSKIIMGLGRSGYLSWQREGRRNRYTINPVHEIDRDDA